MQILQKLNENISQYSLKENVFYRFQEMFDDVRSRYPNIGTFILVVDQQSLKLLSSALKMADLIKMGVSSIEKLELKRKEHPNTHAIYLLSPSKESISLLISDFEGQVLQLKNTDEKKKKKAQKQKEKEKKKKKKKGKQDDDDEDEQEDDEDDDEVIEENEESKKKRKQDELEPKKPEKKKDLQPPEIQYARVHIFFMNKLPKYLLEEMGKSEKLVKRIRTMKEFNHSFFFFEQNGFHLHLEQSLPILFSKKESQEARIMFECISDQLSTVLPALLRFDKINILYNNQNQSSPSYLFANYFEKKLQEMILKLKESESPYIDPTSGEIYLIIVDRGIDPVTPLLHDYSYQSMIYDLLEVDTEKNIVEYEKIELKKENKASESTKEVKKYKQQLSDHKDEVFAKFRYQNITEALKGIRDDFEKHTENMQRAKSSQNQVRSIEDVNKIIGEFPEYNELLQKYAVHFDLILKCFNTFQKYNLQLNCELEQSMVTGIDDLAKPIKSDTIIQSIQDILNRKDIKSTDRLRIAMIAFITCDLQQDQRQKILNLFELSEQKQLKNLAWLGIQFSDDKNSTFSRVNQQIIDLSKEQYNAYLNKQKNCQECKKIRADAKKSKKGGNSEEDQKRDCDECGQLYFVFSVMRHTPLSAIAIHSAIKQIIKSYDVSKDALNSLGFGIKQVGQVNRPISPLKEQPLLNEESEMQSENKLQSTNSSKQVKSSKKKDKDKKKDKEESKSQKKEKGDLHLPNEYEAFLQQSESEDSDALKKSKKIIAFFIGGISYAEIRAIRKFQDEYQSNPVIIGATHLLTHRNYIEEIDQMSTFA
ncbi:Sec1 family protein (macronuclear) [Tetrahymena thermophila SB210]|uniref:Sec1 family protein n=1 Tax=Tetrahymena thermophila (strain SB210) TaxID=312017 RepID=Q22XY4_TETTS|nr:Sec1 family protein [Tetrahymena thermophila SB210]EAR90240.2 Sec1 family protein [Tetrahymena thermophila SB210]|eukprot:XP_001010485.2 Sec1 family protein [Tetrahymena thermophila SB210]